MGPKVGLNAYGILRMRLNRHRHMKHGLYQGLQAMRASVVAR